MTIAEIKAFIYSEKSTGVSEDEIIERLKKIGWSKEEITLGMMEYLEAKKPEEHRANTPETIPVPMPQKYTGMWDAFEHILLFICLYIMTFLIGATLNYLVDKWFPGISINSSGYFYQQSNDEWQLILLRGYLAGLIVSVPLFSFFFLDITKRTLNNPMIHQIKARKVLIYFTLILTFLILVGEIISIIYSLISGNVTLNFFLHFIVTLFVSGSVFLYYFWQIKEDRKIHA